MVIKKRFLCMLIVISMLLGINPGVVKADYYADEFEDDYTTYNMDKIEYNAYGYKYNGISLGIYDIGLTDHIALYTRKKGTKKWTLVSDNLKMDTSRNSSSYGHYLSDDHTYRVDSITVCITGLEQGSIYEFRFFSEILNEYSDIFTGCTCFKEYRAKVKNNKITWKTVPNVKYYYIEYRKHWSYNEGFTEKDKWIEVKCKKNITSYTVNIKDKKHISVKEAIVKPYRDFGDIGRDTVEYWDSSECKNKIKMKIK